MFHLCSKMPSCKQLLGCNVPLASENWRTSGSRGPGATHLPPRFFQNHAVFKPFYPNFGQIVGWGPPLPCGQNSRWASPDQNPGSAPVTCFNLSAFLTFEPWCMCTDLTVPKMFEIPAVREFLGKLRVKSRKSVKFFNLRLHHPPYLFFGAFVDSSILSLVLWAILFLVLSATSSHGRHLHGVGRRSWRWFSLWTHCFRQLGIWLGCLTRNAVLHQQSAEQTATSDWDLFIYCKQKL